jgi:transmembrane protein EpsG
MKSFPIYIFAEIIALSFLGIWTYQVNNFKRHDIRVIGFAPKRLLIVFSVLPLFLLLALRHQVGADYNIYRNAYVSISAHPLFSMQKTGYEHWFGSGFVIICKIIAQFANSNYLYFFAVISLISIMALYFSITKNSVIPLLSLLIYISDGYFYQLFNQARQGLAILLTFVSYTFILNRKPKMFIITVLIAALVHQSALIFLPAYFITRYKFSMKLLFSMLALGILLSWMWPIVERIVSYTKYASYLDSKYDIALVDVTILWAAYRLFFFCFCLLFRKKVVQQFPQADMLYTLCAISIMLQILSLRSYTFARTVIYFYISMLLLLPYVVKSIKKENRPIFTGFVFIILTVVHVYYFVSKADILLAPVYRTFIGNVFL